LAARLTSVQTVFHISACRDTAAAAVFAATAFRPLYHPTSILIQGEAASVVLMGDRLSQVVDCISLGKATLSKIKQNLAWALIYNVVGIPLAAGALLPSLGIALNPSAAGGMMAFSSVAVVSNSLLLRAQYAADAEVRHARLAGGGSSAAAISGTS
jgi:Cu2+-exporting ATPase